MGQNRIVTLEELRKHRNASDCWIAIHGRVFDITKFLPDHPGGGEVISSISGADVTADFEDIGHSDAARKIATPFFIGFLENHQNKDINLPLIKDLKTESPTFVDTRLVVLSGVVVLIGGIAAFFAMKKVE